MKELLSPLRVFTSFFLLLKARSGGESCLYHFVVWLEGKKISSLKNLCNIQVEASSWETHLLYLLFILSQEFQTDFVLKQCHTFAMSPVYSVNPHMWYMDHPSTYGRFDPCRMPHADLWSS